MALASIPNNFLVQTANVQNLVTWDLVQGATSYQVQRSLDNITYTNYALVAINSYLDTSVSPGIAYYYQVASVNGSGTGAFTVPQSVIPTVSGDMSLAAIRLAAQQRADRINSNFVTTQEWNSYINQALYELYDILVTIYEDYFVAEPVFFTVNGSTANYPIPDGVTVFQDSSNNNVVAPAQYKLLGIDLAVNTASNAYVTLNKFNFISRNTFVYPNTASTIYGVFNLRYREMGNKIQFIPTPSANQTIRIWYIPRLKSLLADTDVTNLGISGWLEYTIVRAAKYALDKEESDTSKLDAELVFLKTRIEEAASNRDAGRPDTISDVRQSYDGWGNGTGDPFRGGF